MSNVKVIVFGVGSVGMGIIRTLQNRKGVEVAGAIDIDPAKVGKDAGEVSGIAPIGVTVTDDLEAFCAENKADVIVNTASPVDVKKTFEQLLPAIRKGVNVIVASAETCNLWFTDKELAKEIDEACKKNGISYIGRGATQTEERFIISMTEGSTDVKNIVFTHYADVQAFSDESNAAEWGISMQEKDYYDGVKAGTVKSKEELKESIPNNSEAFGLEIDQVTIEKTPMVNYNGRIYGFKATVCGLKKGEKKLELNYVMVEDPERKYYDHLKVEGTPMIDCMCNYTPDRGMASTIGSIVNAIPYIAGAPAGYHNTLESPACGIYYGDYNGK